MRCCFSGGAGQAPTRWSNDDRLVRTGRVREPLGLAVALGGCDPARGRGGDSAAPRRELRQAGAAVASVHPHPAQVRLASGGPQPDHGGRAAQARRHLRPCVPRGLAQGHGRRVLPSRRQPHDASFALDAQRSLHRQRRRRTRSQCGRSARLQADRRRRCARAAQRAARQPDRQPGFARRELGADRGRVARQRPFDRQADRLCSDCTGAGPAARQIHE